MNGGFALPGRVYFMAVPAGEGGSLMPEAARALGRADVVLCDDQVAREILVGVPARTAVLHIEECGADEAAAHERICAKVLGYVSKGQTVVRITRGETINDGNEEIALLEQAGIDFEVVPCAKTAPRSPATHSRASAA